VSITDNATNGAQTVALSGVGVPPAVTLSPSSITFPAQYVGTSGLPQTVTLTNNGIAAVTVTSVMVSPADFAPLSSCESSVPPATSCSIGVFFDPTTSGARSGTLAVVDSGSATPQTVSLTGTGQDFSMAPSGLSTATVTPGETANYKLSVAPGGGFNQTVTFSCSGAPALSTCTVSPSSVALSGSSSTSVNVTLTTAGTSAELLYPNEVPPVGNRPALWFGLSGLSGLILLGSSGDRSRKWHRGLLYGLAFVSLFSLGVTLSACGSSSGGGTGGKGGGTPAGTYSVTVAGSFSSGATTLTHNTKLTLVVQ